jgi:hypothetical protein
VCRIKKAKEKMKKNSMIAERKFSGMVLEPGVGYNIFRFFFLCIQKYLDISFVFTRLSFFWF